MLQYKFTSTDALMNFIIKTTELLEWNVVICSFSTSNGLNIDMNTKVVDSLGHTDYIKFKYLYATLNNFYQTVIQNNYSDLNIQIKFQLPKALKDSFDTNDEYYNFFLNVYSDNISNITSSSYLEKSRDSGLAPSQSFDIYFSQIYQKWYNAYITNLN
jgi:hypothetical protein